MTSALGGGTQREDELREVALILYSRSVQKLPNADKARGRGVQISQNFGTSFVYGP